MRPLEEQSLMLIRAHYGYRSRLFRTWWSHYSQFKKLFQSYCFHVIAVLIVITIAYQIRMNCWFCSAINLANIRLISWPYISIFSFKTKVWPLSCFIQTWMCRRQLVVKLSADPFLWDNCVIVDTECQLNIHQTSSSWATTGLCELSLLTAAC